VLGPGMTAIILNKGRNSNENAGRGIVADGHSLGTAWLNARYRLRRPQRGRASRIQSIVSLKQRNHQRNLRRDWDMVADTSLHPRTIAALDYAAPNAASHPISANGSGLVLPHSPGAVCVSAGRGRCRSGLPRRWRHLAVCHLQLSGKENTNVA